MDQTMRARMKNVGGKFGYRRPEDTLYAVIRFCRKDCCRNELVKSGTVNRWMIGVFVIGI